VRFIWIVCDIFLDYSNGSNCGFFMGHAGHSVLYGGTQQLIMHSETICEACNPPETSSVVVDPARVSVPFNVYARTDFQEIAARPADRRLRSAVSRTSPASRTNKENSQQSKNG
jgi:hypothetical protein